MRVWEVVWKSLGMRNDVRGHERMYEGMNEGKVGKKLNYVVTEISLRWKSLIGVKMLLNRHCELNLNNLYFQSQSIQNR